MARCRNGKSEFKVEGGISPNGVIDRGIYSTIRQSIKEAKAYPYSEVWIVKSRGTKKEQWSSMPVFIYPSITSITSQVINPKTK
jgi:hypothetical protein